MTFKLITQCLSNSRQQQIEWFLSQCGQIEIKQDKQVGLRHQVALFICCECHTGFCTL